MFTAPNEIAMGGNQPIVYHNSQAQGQQRPQQQQQQHTQQQQMLSQYGGYQQQQHPQPPPQQQQQLPQQQQQQSYMPYPNAGPNMGKGGAVNSMAFQPYVPQQQMFPYNYPPQQQQQQQQQTPSNQYAPQVALPQQQQQPPQQQPPQQHQQQQQQHPRNLGYNPQGSTNSTNQFMGGSGGHVGYRGGRGRGGMQGGGYGHFHRQVHNSYFYNQQHHYSSNNAVPEKTPTVHLINPDTKKIISIKLNRIYSTMADIRPQLQHQRSHNHHNANDSNEVSVSEDKNERSEDKGEAAAAVPKFDPKSTKLVLCLNFLSPHGCIHGSGCDKVHIAGLEYTWPQVEAQEVEKDGKKAYKAGFHVQCYDPTLTRYYKVPSESIHVTKGSTDYVAMYNDHGDNFKMKFKLCPSVKDHSDCPAGAECADIHCAIRDLGTVRESNANATHINSAEAMSEVRRLPADMTVRVFNQNSFDTWHDYPGTNVLMTEGAKAYQKQFELEMNNVPTRKRMQHCAHFRMKDMCRLGESCRFLHVLPTEQEIKERKEAEEAAAAKAKEEDAEKEAAAA